MTQTVFNISLGKHSFSTSKLPAPNQNFILTELKVQELNRAPGKTDWWKSYLYCLSKGQKCFGISDIHIKVLEAVGLEVLLP